MEDSEPKGYPPAWTEEMIQEYEQELAEDEDYLIAEEDRADLLKQALDEALEQEKIASAERIAIHKDELSAASAMKGMEAEQIKDMQTQETDHEQDHALQELSESVCQLHKKLEDITIRLDVNEIGKL